MLPGNSPVFIRTRRLHDELFARQLEHARQVFADKGSQQCTFDVIGKSVSAVVDRIRAKGSLVAALRILLRGSWGLCLRVAFHHLDRHVAVAGEDKQPSRVGLVNLPVCALLFERDEPPCSDKPVTDAVISMILCAGQSHGCDTDKQRDYAERKQFLHVQILVTRILHLLAFERSHVNREAVLHIGLEQSLVGFVDLLDRDDFNIGGDVVLTAKIEHLLSFGDAADV